MKVWIVFVEYLYDSGRIEGIYSNLEAAIAAFNKCTDEVEESYGREGVLSWNDKDNKVFTLEDTRVSLYEYKVEE